MTTRAIHIEGNLISADLIPDILGAEIKGQQPQDFGFKAGDNLEDEIAFVWSEAKSRWAIFQGRLARLVAGDAATSLTREQWAIPLLELLGYQPSYQAKAEVIDNQTFAISHRAGMPSPLASLPQEQGNLDSLATPPIQVIGCRLSLEKRPPSGTPRLSAHGLVQEFLNRTEHLWGIATNGYQWRLLRDCSLMTRLTFVEFDLEQIFTNENFADFRLFYRLFHRSRLPEGMEDSDRCLLEHYYQETLSQGGRVRDNLRDGVESALKILGNGFLQHPQSEGLRQALTPNSSPTEKGEGELTAKTFYRQLLMLIYRCLFLMVAESRNLLLAGEDGEKGRIYQEYYSISRLRELAQRPTYLREGFQDLWQGLQVTFSLFDESWRGEILGLSPLNGDLFGARTLSEMAGYAIDNHDLLLAIRGLSLYSSNNQLRRVNYGALDVEELGSVYESLLDFTPRIRVQGGIYRFELVAGSERKTTGSYYTPPELVGQLIKSALEPVIEGKVRSCALAPKSGAEAQQQAQVRSCALAQGDRAEAQQQALEEALLGLKVCDPACGSGHFLLAAARRIGKELARIRTGEVQPTPEALRIAIRDVIQHCIYGVDLNPLAVDLCKVALWIEGFCKGMPLNFLDHRIKCGNSLVGVLDISVLDEGIPDNAFKPVTGDDKKWAGSLKKRNKQEKQDIEGGQLSLFDNLDSDRSEYAVTWRELGNIPETNTDEVKRKQQQYQRSHSEENQGWWRDYSACNLWTCAFFMALTEQNLQLLPTSAALHRLLKAQDNLGLKPNNEHEVSSCASAPTNLGLKTTNEQSIVKLVEAANKLAQEKRFFHWCLEFPEVFYTGVENRESRIGKSTENDSRLTTHDSYKKGFDCVLGNPPWERIKLQEKEFFASRDENIANAQNKAARTKLIKQLAQDNPALLQAFEDAKHDADAQSKFIRESGRFPLTAVGDINTYAVFAETVRKLINSEGRVGVIVPVGIATDNTTKDFFGDLIKTNSLASLIGFENEAFIFSEVHHAFKFCALGITGERVDVRATDFVFFCRYFADVNEEKRHFTLSAKDIALINPNTFTCPIFRTRPDAEITKKIYQRVPVLENESTGSNPWGISFMRMFDMANDSHLFKEQVRSCASAPDDLGLEHNNEPELLPLYEAKMFHQFDHRYSTYEGATQANLNAGILPQTTPEIKQDPYFTVQPRYWVDKVEVESRLAGKWDKEWLLGFRDISNAVSERTAIFCLFPQVAVGNNAPIILVNQNKTNLIACLIANFCSLIFDFVTRHKVGGNHLNFFIVKQLPIIPPDWYTEEDIEYISSRVLELVYTAYDIKPFAEDMEYDGEPFIWDEQRRAILRAELDAKYAKLYSLTRDQLRYILDPADIYGEDFPSETFRVLKNNEMKKYGEYRTQRLVLAAWDMMGY